MNAHNDAMISKATFPFKQIVTIEGHMTKDY